MNRLAKTGMLCALLVVPGMSVSQGFDRFNMILDLNYESADRTVELYFGRGDNPGTVARLKGSRVALATTELLAKRPLDLGYLEGALEAAKFNQDLLDDVFRMKDARRHAAEIQELLTELRKRNFDQKVVSTVQQLFPEDTRIAVRIPVFFVAFGHENIDAFVRRVVWHGDEPSFVGEGEGEQIIVVNVAKAVSYGSNVDERFLGLMSVVAHEAFHAAFGAYKEGSPVWHAIYAAKQQPLDYLLDLAQNEGIAYYLSLIQRTHGKLPGDWAERAQSAMEVFNQRAEELIVPTTSPYRVREILQSANTSGFWGSFGSITGMVMARQIDQTLGRQALTGSIALGRNNFFVEYIEAQRQSSGSPLLSDKVARYVQYGR